MIKIMKIIWLPVIIILIFIAIPFIKSDKEIEKHYEGPEALQWLKNNENPYAFASNRFESTEGAIKFVEKLYIEGSEWVKISQECIRDDEQTIKEEGGPAADGLVVKLPKDKTKRKAVFDICAQEMIREGFEISEKDIQNNMIFLWWD